MSSYVNSVHLSTVCCYRQAYVYVELDAFWFEYILSPALMSNNEWTSKWLLTIDYLSLLNRSLNIRLVSYLSYHATIVILSLWMWNKRNLLCDKKTIGACSHSIQLRIVLACVLSRRHCLILISLQFIDLENFLCLQWNTFKSIVSTWLIDKYRCVWFIIVVHRCCFKRCSSQSNRCETVAVHRRWHAIVILFFNCHVLIVQIYHQRVDT
jgi:hypothetical protein